MKTTSQKFKELDSKNSEFENRFSNIETEYSTSLTQINSINESIKSTQSRIESNEQEQNGIKNTLAVLSSDVDKAKQDIATTTTMSMQTASSLSNYESKTKKSIALKQYDKEKDIEDDIEDSKEDLDDTTNLLNGALYSIRESGRLLRFHLDKENNGTLHEIYNGYNPHSFLSLGKNKDKQSIVAYIFYCLYKNDDSNTIFQTTDDLHGDSEVYVVEGPETAIDAAAWAAGTYKRKDILAVYDKASYLSWEPTYNEWKSEQDAYNAYQNYLTEYHAWKTRHDNLTDQLANAQETLSAAQKQKTDWDTANSDSTETNPYINAVETAQRNVNDIQAEITSDTEPAKVEQVDPPKEKPTIENSACKAKRRGYVFLEGDTVRDGKVYHSDGSLVTDIDSSVSILQEESKYLYEIVTENGIYYSYNNTETGAAADRVYTIPQDSNFTAVSIGPYTSVVNKNTIAIGYKAISSAADSIAIGANAKADTENSVAIGTASETGVTNDATVSFGNDSFQRRLTHVANAKEDQDAVPYVQVKALDTAITTTLTNKINALKTDLTKSINDNVSSLTSKITANTTAITNESNARAKAVSDEASARTKADSDLTSKINANATAISNETANRMKAVTDLTTKVTANTTAISNEAKTRADQDTAIKNSISSLQSTLEKKITDSIAAAKAGIENDIDTKIATAKSELETEMNAAIKKAIDDYKASVSSSSSSTTNP